MMPISLQFFSGMTDFMSCISWRKGGKREKAILVEKQAIMIRYYDILNIASDQCKDFKF